MGGALSRPTGLGKASLEGLTIKGASGAEGHATLTQGVRMPLG